MSASPRETGHEWRAAEPPERGYAGLTDTHCHLEDSAFDGDREVVLARARAAGITRVLVPGTDLESSARAAGLAAQEADIRAAVGVHPHAAVTWNTQAERRLRKLAVREGVAAIGEIGLDYKRMHSPRETQRTAFAAQLELAAELGLPVVVHMREALEDTLEAIEVVCQAARGTAPRGVLHAFGGAASAAEWAAAHGWYVGIGGAITYPASGPLRERVRHEAMMGCALLETDAPYLPPEGRRGRRNEPALVALVAERLARESGMDVERVVSLTRRNAQMLLGWEPG